MGGSSAHEAGSSETPPSASPVVDPNREAIERLYAQYASRLHAYCRRRLGNPSDADDAMQETFLKVHQAFHRYDPDAPFWPWLVTIAARVCTDMRRRSERITTGALDTGHAVATEEQAARRATVAVVDEALRSMPGRYRTSIYLKHFEGASYEEIADMQGTSVASVRTALMRGRRELACRIEAIVRAERHWPLPSTVPVVARRLRHRVRGWCHDCNRVVHGAVAVIDSAVSLHALASSAPVAMAIVASLGGGAIERAPQSSATIAPFARVPAVIAADNAEEKLSPLLTVGTRRTGVAIGSSGPPPPAPFFSFGLEPPPTTPGRLFAVTRADAADNDDGSMELYVELIGTKTTWWNDCTEGVSERAACAAARAALPVVEEHQPPAFGTVDVGEDE